MPKKIYILLLLILVSDNLFAKKVIPAGKESYFKSLVNPYSDRFGEYYLKNIYITQNSVRYEYCNKECFYILLKDRSDVQDAVILSKNFAIYAEPESIQIGIRQLLDAIVKNDTGSVFEITDSGLDSYEIHLDIKMLYVLIMSVILIFILSLYKKTSEGISLLLVYIERYVSKYYFVLFSLIILFASYMRFRNIYLPLVEEGSALRLLYSYDNWIYNLFISNDPRHPGLYFVLLGSIIGFFDHPEYAARILSASFSVVSVGVIGLVIRSVNPLNSLLAMLLLSVHPEYLYRSREITDISLFVLTSLISLFFLIKSEQSEKRFYKIMFVVFIVLSCLSSYAAYINLLAFLLYLLIKRNLRDYIKYLLFGLLILSPYIYKMLTSIRDEVYTKTISENFSHIIWGGMPLSNFVSKTLYVLFAGDHTLSLLLLFLFFILISYKRLHLISFLLILANALFVLFSIFFRMMPYYVIFIIISFILLIAYQKEVESSLKNKLLTIFVLIFSFYAFKNNLVGRFETIYIQSYHLKNNPSLIVDRIKSAGIKEIVIDIENDKYIIGYYFFENPFEVLIKSNCFSSGAEPMECLEKNSGRRITVLTMALGISNGWEESSLRKLKGLKYDRFCFIYDKNYPNSVILNYLQNNCKPFSLGEKFLVYECLRI